ncbi:MAG TPA: cupin domain-containing protein [Methylomirabilota bacterium]|nr:cupin domain-containing protein [Methylomirabilota bacterium]
MPRSKRNSPAARKPAIDDDIDVGARLRSLRQIYGLSQRELARRAGVTNGTISLIELNQTSPQLASLKRILNAFPITVAEFFTFDLQSRDRVFFRQQELTEIGGGALSFKLVAAQRHDRRLQVTHEIYQPGADTGHDMITHDGEEGGVVVRGRLEVTVGEQTAVLGPGDAYFFNSRIPHRFRNPGEDECEVVSAATPPSF